MMLVPGTERCISSRFTQDSNPEGDVPDTIEPLELTEEDHAEAQLAALAEGSAVVETEHDGGLPAAPPID